MNHRLFRRAKRIDRAARWVITGGGVAIVAAVVTILLLILNVALPLFRSPRIELLSRAPLASPGAVAANLIAVGVDEYLKTPYAIDRKGAMLFAADGKATSAASLKPPHPGATLQSCAASGPQTFTVLWSDGTVEIATVGAKSIQAAATFSPAPASPKTLRAVAQIAVDGIQTCARLAPGNVIHVAQNRPANPLLGGDMQTVRSSFQADLSGDITCILLDAKGSTLYAGTSDGVVARWDLSDAENPAFVERTPTFPDRAPINALALVLGEESLVVGDARGRLTTWSETRSGSGAKKLHLIHTLRPHNAPIEALAPAPRTKAIASLDSRGAIHVDHVTSERRLFTMAPARDRAAAFAISPRGDGMVIVDGRRDLTLLRLICPHPEVSARTLFGKVWYEAYDAPAYVWQSSASSEEAEPKMSLVPLIFGSLKGAAYAMLFAIPLALAGALYTSQFAGITLRKWIKPTVELMASVPSVVVGFLAALWLAPLIESRLVPFFLSIVLLPFCFALFLVFWQFARRIPLLHRLEKGHEFLILIPVILFSLGAARLLGAPVEAALFHGSLKLWLFDHLGVHYEQRNSIIIGFGLGFAVIPIIFTMADDAFSNVPHSLTVGSLALGASRWQTAWRVVLPSASPGIFAGIMIGFGRAVGETMIVLMATGNTAIMSWSPFNGMRTLAANIAVEIPEAPVDGTLYRVLFLSAVLLFCLTFILNTGAEIVRRRLRIRYGQFH